MGILCNAASKCQQKRQRVFSHKGKEQAGWCEELLKNVFRKFIRNE